MAPSNTCRNLGFNEAPLHYSPSWATVPTSNPSDNLYSREIHDPTPTDLAQSTFMSLSPTLSPLALSSSPELEIATTRIPHFTKMWKSSSVAEDSSPSTVATLWVERSLSVSPVDLGKSTLSSLESAPLDDADSSRPSDLASNVYAVYDGSEDESNGDVQEAWEPRGRRLDKYGRGRRCYSMSCMDRM